MKELLASEDAFQFEVLVQGSASRLPVAVSFVTFQKLEKASGDGMMEAAIEYAETCICCADKPQTARGTPRLRRGYSAVRRVAATPRCDVDILL